MKKTILAISIAFLTTSNINAAELNTITQKASYTLGADLSKSFKQQGVEIETDALVAGMKDVINGKELKLSTDEMQQAVNEVKKQVLAKQLKERDVLAAKNLTKGEEFLKKNKKNPDVKTMDNGLQYIVITEGKGAFATEEDYLNVHYRGTLIDGTEFDSSYSRGKPIEFQMGNVIRGWGEALKKMNPGAKWQIFVPTSLAYGEKGAGELIGPNETLIFEMELLTVNKNELNR